MLTGQPENAFLEAIVTALQTLAASTKVDLFTNSPTLSPNNAIADFTVPTFAGYTQGSITVGTLRQDTNFNYIIPLGTVSFQPSGPVSPPQQANGYFITKPSGPSLLMAEYFATPFIFTSALTGLDLVLEWIVPNITSYGGLCAECTG